MSLGLRRLNGFFSRFTARHKQTRVDHVDSNEKIAADDEQAICVNPAS